MAEKITLRAESGRAPGSRNSQRIRRQGGVPAIVYGKSAQPVNIVVDHHDLVSALSTEAGRNALITLDLDGKEILTIPKKIEKHPFRNQVRHVDFLTVSLTETIRADVAIHLVGTAPGLKLGGVESQSLSTIEVECLVSNIPTHVDLDVSSLGLHDSLRVSDLPELEGVTYLDDPETVVVSIIVPKIEVEPEPEEEVAEGEEGAAESEEAAAAEEPESSEGE